LKKKYIIGTVQHCRQTYNPYIPGTPDLPDLETLTQSLDLISILDYVFTATVPVLSVKEDRAYFVGLSFYSSNEQGETACHMCGKSYKGINIHRTACRKRTEKNFILYNIYVLYTLTLLRINKITTTSNKTKKNFS
jgi:hypothetical protein